MKNMDRILLVSVLAILAMGLVALYSASREYRFQDIFFRQVFWILIALALLFLILQIDYQKFMSISYLLYAINIILLLLVLFFGKARGGAHRWISMGPVNLQPSELAKITLVLALASYMARRKRAVHGMGFFAGAAFLVLPVFFLIVIEPDLGTALLLIPVALAMLFAAGVRMRYFAGVAFMGLLSIPFFWYFLRDYQKQRLFVFLNPNIDPLGSGYTVIQSKIAVGSGGILGKGWLSGTQNQLNFLPERHTDFIFSVVGEEWGFFGALVLILLYMIVAQRSIKIAETTPDIYGKLVVTGFITLFSLQAIINIGMTMGLLPVVGLTLPLISYGGSSLVATVVCIAFILNIGMRRPLF